MKRVNEYLSVGRAYFPLDNFDRDAIKRWLRSRGFRALNHLIALVKDGCYRAMLVLKTGTRRIVERFKGEAKCPLNAANTIVAAFDLLLGKFMAKYAAGRPAPRLELKSTRRGYAHYLAKVPHFSIPSWILTYPEAYLIYYIAHELSHCAFGGLAHTPKLCAVEGDLLSDFDIRIEYNPRKEKEYPFRLHSISTGAVLYNKY